MDSDSSQNTDKDTEQPAEYGKIPTSIEQFSFEPIFSEEKIQARMQRINE